MSNFRSDNMQLQVTFSLILKYRKKYLGKVFKKLYLQRESNYNKGFLERSLQKDFVI